jgi:signal transduction histidine kinase
MNSIQFRLVVRLLAGMLAVLFLGSLAVYLVFRSAMVRQFDQSLRAEAQSIAMLFVRDDDGRYEFHAPADANRLFRHGRRADLFCIRRLDGRVAVKSASLGKADCPGLETAAAYEGAKQVAAPAGSRHAGSLRARYLVFVPPAEIGVSPDRFQLVLAAEHWELDELLERLIRALCVMAVFGGAVAAFLVAWTVRRDLAPLRALAAQAGRIGAGEADKRFELTDAPYELLPIRRALNGLLERMAATLKRERRFTADAAHELRTPVAELRSLCEVALAAGDPKAAAEALADAREIAGEMERLIEALLALRRSGEKAVLVPVDAAALAQEAWNAAAEEAAKRSLAISWQGAQSAPVLCDKTLLLGVLRNLFDNAVHYTPPGGSIECRISAAQVLLRNRPHNLTAADIAHLKEPFWRKDAARSGPHAGLGLALVEAYCRSFGGEFTISLEEDGWLACEVRFTAG